MCRIAGFFEFDQSRQYDHEETLRLMRDSLHYGGPDSEGEFFDLDNRLALGHRRLSIIDLSENGRQPWRAGPDVLVFNGEFYNFHEVRDSFEHKIDFKTESDTEVLVKGIQNEGMEFLKRVRGMFGLALWNIDERRLILCRDRVGVKPLYYYHHENLLMFSSELKAFHYHPFFNNEIDNRAVATFLMYGYIPAPNSIYKHVKKLLPGSYLCVDEKQKIDCHRYWSADETFAQAEVKNVDEKTAVDELEAVLKDSVQLRLVADVPVGIFLSGGVDSSLVTAVLQKHSNQQLKTFTIGFDDKKYDESAQAAAIAKHLGTSHHERICTEDDFLKIVPRLPEIVDEPFGDASIIPTYLVAEFAAEQVKVSLSADGGDELFGGYTKYLFVKKWRSSIAKMPVIAKKMLAASGRAVISSKLLGRLAAMAIQSKFSNVEAKIAKSVRTLDAVDLESLFDLASSYSTPAQLARLTAAVPYSRTGQMESEQTEERLLSYLGLLDVNHYLEGDILTKVDRATMRVALEGRDPLLDQQLIAHAFSLPDHFKLQNGTNKYLLRKVLSRYLPSELIDQRKHGFNIPVRQWLVSQFSDKLEALAHDQSFCEAFQFESSELNKTIGAFLKDKNYRDAQFVWFLFVLYLWYERWHQSGQNH